MNKNTFVSHEEFDIVFELSNPGVDSLSLIKIESVVPLSFRITRVSNNYSYRDNVIDFRGKRLRALSSIEVSLGVVASSKGQYSINPNVVYIDGNGVYREVEAEPVSIEVEDMQSVLEKMLGVRQSFQKKKDD